jgi:hypothetical protein
VSGTASVSAEAAGRGIDRSIESIDRRARDLATEAGPGLGLQPPRRRRARRRGATSAPADAACGARLASRARRVALAAREGTHLSVVRGRAQELGPDAVDLSVVLGHAHLADGPRPRDAEGRRGRGGGGAPGDARERARGLAKHPDGAARAAGEGDAARA